MGALVSSWRSRALFLYQSHRFRPRLEATRETMAQSPWSGIDKNRVFALGWARRALVGLSGAISGDVFYVYPTSARRSR